MNDATSFIHSVLCANDVCEEDGRLPLIKAFSGERADRWIPGMLYLNARSPFTSTTSEVFSREYAHFLDLLGKELSDLHGHSNVHREDPKDAVRVSLSVKTNRLHSALTMSLSYL